MAKKVAIMDTETESNYIEIGNYRRRSPEDHGLLRDIWVNTRADAQGHCCVSENGGHRFSAE